MRRVMVSLLAVVVVLGAISTAWSNSRTDDPLGVAVSPQMLILGMDQGGAVTVHTAIKYSQVEAGSVTLNGLAAESTWADSCGNLVARFSETAVEALVAPPSAVLTLEGVMVDGTAFAGSDTVRVAE